MLSLFYVPCPRVYDDLWWNPATENQATVGAHRIGQTNPVFVH